jgi:hypothetical protein
MQRTEEIMNYGVLLAIGADGSAQVVGVVDSYKEAQELMNEYIALGPEHDCLAPETFEIQRRDQNGFYTIRETVYC